MISEEMLSRFEAAGFRYRSFEDIKVRRTMTFEAAVRETIDFASSKRGDIGIELDTDVIQNFPSSAQSPAGFLLEDALHYVYQVARSTDALYCSLMEGAPIWSPRGADNSPVSIQRMVGKALSNLVLAYVKGREERKSKS